MILRRIVAILFVFLLTDVTWAQVIPSQSRDTSKVSMREEIVDPNPIDVYDPMADMIRIEAGTVPHIAARYAAMANSDPTELAHHPFLIDKYEVTNRQFAKFLSETDSASRYFDRRMDIIEISPQRFLAKRGREDYPAVYVDWYGAYAFAQWAGKSLPTAEEWMIAALGTQSVPDSGSIYPWGTTRSDSTYANGLNTGSFPRSQAVGTYPKGASPYGVMDLAGNVAEWTTTERTYHVADSLSVRLIVVKGGSFLDPAENLTLLSQTFRGPNERLSSVGFRCIKREQ